MQSVWNNSSTCTHRRNTGGYEVAYDNKNAWASGTKKKLSRPKPPLIPANAVIDLDAVMMGANKQKAPKFHRNFVTTRPAVNLIDQLEPFEQQ